MCQMCEIPGDPITDASTIGAWKFPRQIVQMAQSVESRRRRAEAMHSDRRGNYRKGSERRQNTKGRFEWTLPR